MIIYQIRCLLDNRVYIGKTINLSKRWKGHLSLVKTGKGYWIHDAIRKYGLDNFVVEILKENATDQDEIDLIHKHRKNSFNIHVGGQGGDNLTFHPNKAKIFEKRKLLHRQNVCRGTQHPKWIDVSNEVKNKIVREYFDYSLPSPIDICEKYMIKKDVFNRIIRERAKLYRSAIERFSHNRENIDRVLKEYRVYNIQEIRDRGCGLGTDSISLILKRNNVVVKG